MRLSGAIRFTYGVECPSDRMLDYIGKGITVKQAHQRLKLASDLGIWNQLLLITGLPTETEEDTKHFVEFLEESAEYSNAYSISSFYLISSSLMGAFPERYGIEMMTNPSGLLEDQAFNEKGGLPWARKKRQIIRSTEIITDAIKRIKKDPKYWSGAIDLELIFWLYDRLGHDGKKDIVRCYEDAFLGSPAHPKSYVPAMKQLLGNGHGVNELLARSGMRARPEELRVVQETLYLPVEAAQQRLDLEFRVLGYGASPTFTSGRNLGTSVAMDTGFADALAELIAPGVEGRQRGRAVGMADRARRRRTAHGQRLPAGAPRASDRHHRRADGRRRARVREARRPRSRLQRAARSRGSDQEPAAASLRAEDRQVPAAPTGRRSARRSRPGDRHGDAAAVRDDGGRRAREGVRAGARLRTAARHGAARPPPRRQVQQESPPVEPAAASAATLDEDARLLDAWARAFEALCGAPVLVEPLDCRRGPASDVSAASSSPST